MTATIATAPRPCEAAALDYAARGWPVFPVHSIRGGRCTCKEGADCERPGKHPRTRHGRTEATTDETTIKTWWRTGPDANIGILTGPESGLIALDVAPRRGGDATLKALLAAHGPLPKTVESLTGGGGRHILLQHPGGTIKSVTNKLGPGLDVIADDGSLVVPPSVHVSGKPYQWEPSSDPGEVPVAPCPPWLVALLQDTPPAGSCSFPGGCAAPGPQGPPRKGLCREGADGGNRNRAERPRGHAQPCPEPRGVQPWPACGRRLSGPRDG